MLQGNQILGVTLSEEDALKQLPAIEKELEELEAKSKNVGESNVTRSKV